MQGGMIELYTGTGKGKTTASVGLAVRALGAGGRVLFAQFLKGRETGEIASLKALGADIVRCDEITKFVPYMTAAEHESCRCSQHKVLAAVKEAMPGYDVLILDEICCAINTGMLDIGEVLEIINEKPPKTELVLTGRDAPAELIECADYVSRIDAEKHPYDRGVQARKGIEF